MNIKNETSAGGIVFQKLTTNDPSIKLRVLDFAMSSTGKIGTESGL